jgi:hypothetical protein
MTSDQTDSERTWLLVWLVIAGLATLLDEFVNSIWFKILKVGGLVVSTWLAIYRWRTYRPYVCYVAESQWTLRGSEVEYVIAPKKHKRGATPPVACAVKKGDAYHDCGVDIIVDPVGAVHVRASKPFPAVCSSVYY